MSEVNVVKARATFDTLCHMLDTRDWHYSKDTENMSIDCNITGDDLSMRMIMIVRSEQQVVSLLSPLPFKMDEDKRVEGALAVATANYGLINGSFDYDLRDGEIRFRMVSSFRDSALGDDLFEYMLLCSASTVDKYNDRFLMLSKGMMTLEQFIEMDNQG